MWPEVSTTTKGLPNACPTCLQPANLPCKTVNGIETNAHVARVRGEWPQVLCRRPASGTERVGAACPLCGHTNYVHPQSYANPGLTACVICEMQEHVRGHV